MWNIIDVPPQPFGECSICKRHTCGEYEEMDANGKKLKKQKWLVFPLNLDPSGQLVIGYQCVQGMAEDAGISKRIVEKRIMQPPTDDHIADYVRRGLQGHQTSEESDDKPARGRKAGSTV